MTPTNASAGQSEQPEPARPGTYGRAPESGNRLPDALALGRVVLQVASLARSLAFYEQVLGLRVLSRTTERAELAPQGDARVLVELREHPGAAPVPRRGRTGLFHFAILLPDRASLGRFVSHLGAIGVRAGAGDHIVSEAFYLSDPDGLGIEVYADRPRDTWTRVGRQLVMATDPVDVTGVLAAAGGAPWRGMPAGTVMGHLHLHVGDITRAGEFYGETFGFDRMAWSYPGALFFAAGGYHHHLGTNIWAGSGARPPAPDEAQLIEWTVVLPDAASLASAAARLERGGGSVERAGDGASFVARDPWGTAMRVRLPE